MNSNASPPGFSDLETALDPLKLPRHVAIIMDGNGRWARKRLLNRVLGHEQGAQTVRRIVETSRQIGISVLTLYAFSTENWQRPRSEVAALMGLLKRFIESEEKTMMENQIRLTAIGQTHRLPGDVRQALEKTMKRTEKNRGMLLNLALSYGARAEIVQMVRGIGEKIHRGEMGVDGITETIIQDHLYTREIPDPDLLIRTSGEMRISNFLLWQIAYSEIYFTDTLWPDFDREEFIRILIDFQRRDRRFGKVE